jgi:hypothetical protein
MALLNMEHVSIGCHTRARSILTYFSSHVDVISRISYNIIIYLHENISRAAAAAAAAPAVMLSLSPVL